MSKELEALRKIGSLSTQTYTENGISVTLTSQLVKDNNEYKIIEKTLERAKKVEELLELYKKLSNIYEKLYTMELSLLSLNSNYYEIEIIKIKQQINVLEKELEELK